VAGMTIHDYNYNVFDQEPRPYSYGSFADIDPRTRPHSETLHTHTSFPAHTSTHAYMDETFT
jgi:hypothetical protein